MGRSETLALVGSESLIGREIRDVLAGSDLARDLRLIAAEGEEAGTLTEQGGAPALLISLEAETLESARAVFLAGPPASTRKVLELAPQANLIDLTYGAEDSPNARLRAPMVEPKGYAVPPEAVHVIANASAIAVALLLGRVHRCHAVRRSVLHILEPASEQGSPGLEELQQQTVNLLSFKGLPKAVFDAQLAFNVLARYGEEAPAALEQSELRVERHLATLLSFSGRPPMPSLRLIQAPVFHGYTISLWIELESNPGVQALERVLDSDPIDLRSSDAEPPDIVGMAGQSGVAVGGLSLDRNHPQACWFWMVADNLRLRAENAVAVARELL